MPRKVPLAASDRLTDRQEAFAQSVARDRLSQTAAYKLHYKADRFSDEHAASAASAVAKTPKVAARIAELEERRAKTAEIEFDITVKKLLQTFFEKRSA